jgi:hypothetical protein
MSLGTGQRSRPLPRLEVVLILARPASMEGLHMQKSIAYA